MSRSHFALSPLSPTAHYPVNPALMKFPEYRGDSIFLSPEQWSAFGEFFKRMKWDVEWITCAMPRLWIEQAHAQGRLKKHLSLDDAFTIVRYDFAASYDADCDDWMLLSRGLCVSIAEALTCGSMESKAPELHAELSSSVIKWRESGGMCGLYVVD